MRHTHTHTHHRALIGWLGLVAAMVLLPAAGWAQSIPSFQSGAVANSDLLRAFTQGLHGTAGGILGDATNAKGVNPFAITDGGAAGLCFYVSTSNGAVNPLCFGHNASNTPVFSVSGVAYPFGAGTGTVAGPISTTTNEFALWNGTTGTLLKDGAAVNVAHTGNLSITGLTAVTGNLTVSGTSTLTGASTVGGTLGVTGATTLSSTLGVTGASTLTGLATLNGGLTVAGNSLFTSAGTFTVGGTRILQNNNAAAVVLLAGAPNMVSMGNDNAAAGIANLGFGNGVNNGSFIAGRARGTGTTPSAIVNGDFIGVFGTAGHDGTSWHQGIGGIAILAGGNFSSTSTPTIIHLDTVPVGSTEPAVARLAVDSDGGVTIQCAGGTAPTGGSMGVGTLNVCGGLYVNGTAVTVP